MGVAGGGSGWGGIFSMDLSETRGANNGGVITERSRAGMR